MKTKGITPLSASSTLLVKQVFNQSVSNQKEASLFPITYSAMETKNFQDVKEYCHPHLPEAAASISSAAESGGEW
jgi:hypothetical protein